MDWKMQSPTLIPPPRFFKFASLCGRPTFSEGASEKGKEDEVGRGPCDETGSLSLNQVGAQADGGC